MSLMPRKAAKAAPASAKPAKEQTALASAEPSSTKTDFVPSVLVPSALGLDSARQAFVRMKEAGEETSQALEASYKLASSGLTALGAKAVEALKANSDHQFAFLQSLMGIRSPSEALSLQSDYFVKQYANLKAQTSDLVTTAQQIALESSQPLKDTLAKTLKTAA